MLYIVPTNSHLLSFILGTFSIISMLWFIDVGAYINVMLLLILIYFFIRTEYKKNLSILLGIIFGWFIFFLIIPNNEFKTFLNNTLSNIFNI